MAGNEEQAKQLLKTVTVLGAANIVAAPFYWFGKEAGLTATTVANSAVLYSMHEQGKKERVPGNAINGLCTFFGQGKPIENGAKNIGKGGERIFDEVKENLEKLTR